MRRRFGKSKPVHEPAIVDFARGKRQGVGQMPFVEMSGASRSGLVKAEVVQIRRLDFQPPLVGRHRDGNSQPMDAARVAAGEAVTRKW